MPDQRVGRSPCSGNWLMPIEGDTRTVRPGTATGKSMLFTRVSATRITSHVGNVGQHHQKFVPAQPGTKSDCRHGSSQAATSRNSASRMVARKSLTSLKWSDQ
jgi:hypothetical protein